MDLLKEIDLRPRMRIALFVRRRNIEFKRSISVSTCAVAVVLCPHYATAQSSPTVNLCTDLGVQLPVLNATSSLGVTAILPGLNTVLNGVVSDINGKIVTPLSGLGLRAGFLDGSGALTPLNGQNCNVQASRIGLTGNNGVSIGGGAVTGLGGGTVATAGDVSAIAIGNGASTGLNQANAIALGSGASGGGTGSTALGLRSSASAADAMALGTDATASASRAVALGAGSLADRTGLNGPEAFSGTVIATTNGAVSVGSGGSERQITNLAGGTQATDAVNVRQLSAVGNQLARSLGGGARFDVSTNTYTGPVYQIRGATYTDVSTALNAIDLNLVSMDTRIANANSTTINNNTTNTTSSTNYTTNNTNSYNRSSTTTSTTANNAPASGSDTIVSQDTQRGSISIGVSTGGTVVSVAGADGLRRLSGLAEGVDGSDAVNVSQLTAIAQGLRAGLDDVPLRADNSRGLGGPTAAAADAYASGYGATASAKASIAIGIAARAAGDSATSIGTDSSAVLARATAVGARSVAGGQGSAAYGADAIASADGTTALGAGARASGNGATSLGSGAIAGDVDTVAIGRGATAGQSNAIALGAGATTTRANQVAIGTASSTYTMAGISSSQSRAAQTGATRFVTADASGNLAASEYGPSTISGLQSQVGGLSTQVSDLARYAAASNREARQGIAAAMAMTSASMPSLPGKTSWTVNGATFKGEWAGGVALAHRLDTAIPIAVTAGYSYSEASRQGARVGLAGEF